MIKFKNGFGAWQYGINKLRLGPLTVVLFWGEGGNGEAGVGKENIEYRTRNAEWKNLLLRT